jgi:hypothetical protein
MAVRTRATVLLSSEMDSQVEWVAGQAAEGLIDA